MTAAAGVLRWLGLPGAGEALPERVVVVSPHLDDAVLSLGGAISRASRAGAHVTVLTVLAGDSDSSEPAGSWDRRAGFETEADATRGRREEDRRACARVGADPEWLPFSDNQYGRPKEEDVIDALGDRLHDAVVLLPGFPLEHPDHAWVNALLMGGELGLVRLGHYVEQPYAMWAGKSAPPTWRALPAALRDRFAKDRACRQYSTQLPLLGEKVLTGIARYEAKRGGEAVSWLG